MAKARRPPRPSRVRIFPARKWHNIWPIRFRTQVLFWMLAAIDGHAKNFSVFIEPGGFYRVAPRYDVLSAHSVMGHGAGRLFAPKVKTAMAIDGKNRHYKWAEIRREHFEQTALNCRLPDAPALIDELVTQTLQAIAEVADDLSGPRKVFRHSSSDQRRNSAL